MTMTAIKLGIMGFGRIGRQVYRLAVDDPRFEIVVIADIGKPEILHHLWMREAEGRDDVQLIGNYMITERFRTRIMPSRRPSDIPWDLFGVDAVIDATGSHQTYDTLEPHLAAGSPRVVLSTLPRSEIDRVVIPGVNTDEATVTDRIVSAGSSTTTAMALTVKSLLSRFSIEHATMTSIHAYTSDQSLQDYAGPDYRRSRSGAENIIPNSSLAPEWVGRVLPQLRGKTSGYALNVPVQTGSLLDLNVSFEDSKVGIEDVNTTMQEAARDQPELIEVTADPIVSSDVKGSRRSVLFDLGGTVKAGRRTIKMLIWHESLGHANRILDLIRLYAELDSRNSGGTH